MDYQHNEITLNPAIPLTIPLTKPPPNAWDDFKSNHLPDNKKHLFSPALLNSSTNRSETNVIKSTPEVRQRPKDSPPNSLYRSKLVKNKHKRLSNENPPNDLNNYIVNNTINRHRTKNVIANPPTKNAKEHDSRSKSEPKVGSKDSFQKFHSNNTFQKSHLNKDTKEEDFVKYDKMCVF